MIRGSERTGTTPEDGPRNPSQPFAFTRDEFWDAAGRACWMSVLGVTAVTWLAMWPEIAMGFVLAGIVGIVLIAPVGLVGILVFAPVVKLVARTMRRVRRRSAHLAAQAALGFLVGGAIMAIVGALFGPYGPSVWLFVAYAAVPALVFPWVWSRAERRARLADAGMLPQPRRRIDVDAAAEDAVTARREGTA